VATFIGPAAGLRVEQFNLAPAPAEFEAMFTEQTKDFPKLDTVLAEQRDNLVVGTAGALEELDNTVDEIAAIDFVVNEIGVLEEENILGDISDQVLELDGTTQTTEINLTVERPNVRVVNVINVIEPPKQFEGVPQFPGRPHN
jgi:hypothetical protein